MNLVDAGGRSAKAVVVPIGEQILICFEVEASDEPAYFALSQLRHFYQLLRDTNARMKVVTTITHERGDVIVFNNGTSEKFNDYRVHSKHLEVTIVLNEADLILLKLKGLEYEWHPSSKLPDCEEAR